MEAVAAAALRRSFRDAPEARVATVGPDGAPHAAPAWFVWREDALYLSTRRGSMTWLNAELEPRVSALLDRGLDWSELAGVIVEGRVELLHAEHPSMRGPISDWHQKYRTLLSGNGFERFTAMVPELGFLRLTPDRLDPWNHRDHGP